MTENQPLEPAKDAKPEPETGAVQRNPAPHHSPRLHASARTRFAEAASAGIAGLGAPVPAAMEAFESEVLAEEEAEYEDAEYDRTHSVTNQSVAESEADESGGPSDDATR